PPAMPLSKILTKPTLFFLSLNVLRALSIVAICLVFAGEIYTMVSDVRGYNSASSSAQSPASSSPGALGATASTIITRARLARRAEDGGGVFVPVELPPSSPSSSFLVPVAGPTAAPVAVVDHAAKRMVKHRRVRRAASSSDEDVEAEEETTTTRRARSTSTSSTSPTATATSSSSFSTARPTATNAPYSPSAAAQAQQQEQERCAYVGGTSIPRTTGGVVFGTLERVFTALILLLSLLSESPLPRPLAPHINRFWTYAFPPFGPDFGPSVLGLVQVFVGSVVLARNNEEGSWTQVSGWLVFLVGILNFLAGLALGRRLNPLRSLSADSTSPSALRRLRLANSSSRPSGDEKHAPDGGRMEISSPFDDRHAPVPPLSLPHERYLDEVEQEQHQRQEPEMVAVAGPSFRPARERQPSIKRSASRNGPNGTGIMISPPRPLRPSFSTGAGGGDKREAEDEEQDDGGRRAATVVSPPPPIYFPGSR
ncbi:hypothetical protein JCM6882_004545, partial [Rhodosporidiobolus microsporus]